jgi:hypothetical protein
VSNYERPTLLTNKDEVLLRWKEYIEQYLNESSEEESHTNQESRHKNYVFIDLPCRDEFFEARKYLPKKQPVWTG